MFRVNIVDHIIKNDLQRRIICFRFSSAWAISPRGEGDGALEGGDKSTGGGGGRSTLHGLEIKGTSIACTSIS